MDYLLLPSLSQDESSQSTSLEYELWYSLGFATRIRSFCHSSGLKNLKNVISKQSDFLIYPKDTKIAHEERFTGKLLPF